MGRKGVASHRGLFFAQRHRGSLENQGNQSTDDGCDDSVPSSPRPDPRTGISAPAALARPLASPSGHALTGSSSSSVSSPCTGGGTMPDGRSTTPSVCRLAPVIVMEKAHIQIVNGM